MVNSSRLCQSRRKASRFGPGTPNGVVADFIYREAVRTSTDSRAGSSNPGWKQAIKEVRQAGSPYARTATTLGVVSGSISGMFTENLQKTRKTEDSLSGELFLDNGPGIPLVPLFTSLDVNARINFLKACRASRQAFQGGTFLGELRETVTMIARPGAALRRGISAYLREAKKATRRVKFTDRGRILTKTWLEYSYGWRPLFSEIDAGMKALAEADHLVPDIVVGVAKDEIWSNRIVRQTTCPGSFIVGGAVFRDRARGSCRYLGCVAWESENRARDWKSNWGFTLDNFLPTVWNLIPYSFIVDYFSNLGSVIDASSYGTVALRWGCRSLSRNTTVLMSPLPAIWSSSSALEPRFLRSSFALSQLSAWTFERDMVTKVSVSLNDLQFKVPGVSDWRKWANLAALAIERAY